MIYYLSISYDGMEYGASSIDLDEIKKELIKRVNALTEDEVADCDEIRFTIMCEGQE